MYVTRRLSHLRKYPELASEYPEGPNSGYLVIDDYEKPTVNCCCGSISIDWRNVDELPIPQNQELFVQYVSGLGQYQALTSKPLVLIPVLNEPLSSNRYYAIVRRGKHRGEAFTCSSEKDRVVSCCGPCRIYAKPRELNPQSIYQQFEICRFRSEAFCSPKPGFTGKTIASDGLAPSFFKENWTIILKTPKKFKLVHAKGLDSTLRARLPQLISKSASQPVVVGKWYCPFVFVRDGTLKDQVDRSMYYQMTLEQRWDQIFTCQNDGGGRSMVTIDVGVEKEAVFVQGRKGMMNERNGVDGVVWFRIWGDEEGSKKSFGLRIEVLQRMKWEQEKAGWCGGEENEVKIQREEEHKEAGEWREFGCYVLVERFKLKRMDDSLVMEYDFKHCHQIRTLWE